MLPLKIWPDSAITVTISCEFVSIHNVRVRLHCIIQERVHAALRGTTRSYTPSIALIQF